MIHVNHTSELYNISSNNIEKNIIIQAWIERKYAPVGKRTLYNMFKQYEKNGWYDKYWHMNFGIVNIFQAQEVDSIITSHQINIG